VRASRITARYELHAGEAMLRVSLMIDWFERGDPTTGVPNLRFVVPTALEAATARYEIPFGALDRHVSADQEVPALRWAKLSGQALERSGQARVLSAQARVPSGQAAVVLFNDCKHGHALEGATLRLNLVRSSYEPDYLPDVDRHLVRLALLSPDAPVSDATLAAWAAAHEQPLLAIGTGVHGGELPAAQSLLTVEGADVTLCGLKWAESGEGLVVRLANTTGAPTVAKLACAPVLGTVQSAQPIDLMERSAGEGSAATDGTVSVAVPANGLASWLVRTGQAT
jgi:alpha-mannosidase